MINTELTKLKRTNAPVVIWGKTHKMTIKYEALTHNTTKLMGSNDVSELINEFTENCDLVRKEYFHAIYLKRSNQVISVSQIAVGGSTSCIADGKIIFQEALLVNAQAIILTHNHPSGTLKPSPSDINLTKKLREFGKLIEIEILDHLITTAEGNYYSFADNGLM